MHTKLYFALLARHFGHTFSTGMGATHSDLISALQKGDPGKVRAALVAYSIKADSVRDSSGRTLLCVAAARGNVAVAEALLDAGEAALNGLPDDTTPLIEAAKEGHLPMIHFLCSRGARLNATDGAGCTAMHHAAACGRVDALHELAGRGAGLSIPNNLKYTPLHLAAKHGELESAQALEALGAQLYAKTDLGETPRDIALACGRVLVLDFLQSAMERRPVSVLFV